MGTQNSPKEKGKGQAGPRGCDILIRNAHILTLDANRTIYPSGAVAISGNSIVAVGPEREIVPMFRPRRVLDAGGAPVHPGFVDAHCHATLHLSRGAMTDNPRPKKSIGFFDWFNALDDEDEYTSALAFCVEMVHNGYTGFMEAGTVFEPDVVAAAAEAVGVRASLGDPFLWDLPEGESGYAGTVKRAPCNLKRARDLLGTQLWRNGDPDSLIRAHVAVYGEGSASEELIVAAKECADENDVVFNMHVNFTPELAEMDDLRFGGRHTLVHFADIGVLDRNCTFAHMNVVRDDEVQPVVDSGMSLVWQPGNYLFYGISAKVPSRMAELIGKGVNVAFGVDVAKIWTFGDMEFVGYLVARHGGDYISPEKLLEMQTIGGARALGLESVVGSLEPGKRADLVIRPNNLPELQPGVNVVQEMMQLSRSRSVAVAIVNGEIVLKDGHLTRVDEGVVYDRARTTTRRIMDRLGFSPEISWPIVA